MKKRLLLLTINTLLNTSTINILQDSNIAVNSNYLMQTNDFFPNRWQQYLASKPLTFNFKNTEQWKQIKKWASKNGYQQIELDKMTAEQIADLLAKYKTSTTTSFITNNNMLWLVLGLALPVMITITWSIGAILSKKKQ